MSEKRVVNVALVTEDNWPEWIKGNWPAPYTEPVPLTICNSLNSKILTNNPSTGMVHPDPNVNLEVKLHTIIAPNTYKGLDDWYEKSYPDEEDNKNPAHSGPFKYFDVVLLVGWWYGQKDVHLELGAVRLGYCRNFRDADKKFPEYQEGGKYGIPDPAGIGKKLSWGTKVDVDHLVMELKADKSLAGLKDNFKIQDTRIDLPEDQIKCGRWLCECNQAKAHQKYEYAPKLISAMHLPDTEESGQGDISVGDMESLVSKIAWLVAVEFVL